MSFGHDRERQVKAKLEAKGYFVVRAAASLGYADLVALKDGEPPQMIEVKATAQGPWEGFRRPERRALKNAAKKAGAVPVLAWWPKRGTLVYIYADAWPADNTTVPYDRDGFPVNAPAPNDNEPAEASSPVQRLDLPIDRPTPI